MLDDAITYGPKYFFCVRMQATKFITFMLLIEVIYLFVTASDINAKAQYESPNMFYLSCAYMILFNFVVSIILFRVLKLYEDFDEHIGYFDLG